MSRSGLTSAATIEGGESPTDRTGVVSTHRRVPTNCVLGRTLQSSIKLVVESFSVPSDFLVDGEISGLGTVHPLLTINFFSTWVLPHFMKKTLSFAMDGRQKREKIDIF